MKVYQLNEHIQKNGKNKIAAVLTDVDGVLTDGKIYLDEHGKERVKSFNTKDGVALKELQKSRIPIIIISGRESAIVTKRMNELGITNIYQNVGDKAKTYEKIKKDLNLEGQFIYVGDDLPDVKMMEKGFSFCPSDAHSEVKVYANVVLQSKGGDGCMSEVVSYLRKENML